MTERDPRISPVAGDIIKKELYRDEKLVFWACFKVIIARAHNFGVTGPSPKNWTLYGEVLFEELHRRETPEGELINKSPYGHLKFVFLDEWQNKWASGSEVVNISEYNSEWEVAEAEEQ